MNTTEQLFAIIIKLLLIEELSAYETNHTVANKPWERNRKKGQYCINCYGITVMTQILGHLDALSVRCVCINFPLIKKSYNVMRILPVSHIYIFAMTLFDNYVICHNNLLIDFLTLSPNPLLLSIIHLLNYFFSVLITRLLTPLHSSL